MDANAGTSAQMSAGISLKNKSKVRTMMANRQTENELKGKPGVQILDYKVNTGEKQVCVCEAGAKDI